MFSQLYSRNCHILYTALLILFFVSPPVVTAQGLSCKSVVDYSGKKLIDKSGADYYHVEDPVHKSLMATAYIWERKLNISLFTKLGSGERSPLLRGKEQFDNILKHLEGQYDVLVGHWVRFFDGRKSDNLDEFNFFVSNGFSLKEAAFKTWSGKQAKRHGLTNVDIIRAHGEKGEYKDVLVEFYK